MEKNRLEAFSDGVVAIIITIMVLEMKVPHGADLSALDPIMPVFLSYIMSCFYIGIYWNNHHHMLQTIRKVTGGMLWANLHLLFWLSLFPFVTGWMGANHFSEIPTALYGIVLFMAGIAYLILQKVIINAEGTNSILAQAVGSDWKAKVSLITYAIAILISCRFPIIAQITYVSVAIMWVVPDKRIERILK